MFSPALRLLLFAFVVSAGIPVPAQESGLPQAIGCGEAKSPEKCGVPQNILSAAKDRFVDGVKLSKEGKARQALAAFRQASELVPKDIEYASAREITTQQLVLQYVEQGNSQLANGHAIPAVASFREALQLDPSNPFAQQSLRQVLQTQPAPVHGFRVEDGPVGFEVRPSQQKQSFHFEGDSRELLQKVAAAYGVHATLAESVQSRPVRFDIEQVDFATAMEAAGGVTKTFWSPLSSQEILVAADTRDQRQQYERMMLRTFYLPQTTTAAQLTDVVNALRTIFEIRMVVPHPSNNSIAVRAPRATLETATRFLESLDEGRPQVILDLQVLEVSKTLAHTLGLNLPLEWQAFNVSQQALDLLQQPNVQDLINQLFASGGINQANSTALTALLSQLQSQQNSILNKPFATFGGGSTLTAIPVPPLTANFSRNESRVRILQRLQLRASQGDPATIMIGSRYPILNTTFAPIFNSPALSQVIQGGSFTAPFPSFSYQDLGIRVKATPQVHRYEVTLGLEVEIKSLGNQSFNGVPVISNRSYTGGLRLSDGQSGVLAGTLDMQEQQSLAGPPGLGFVPGLSTLLSTKSKNLSESELLIIVTPHIVALPPEATQALVLRSSP
jgi:tetratricopeptide (TPR) repeat protein